MQNPFGDQQVPGSYAGLQERMLKRVKATNIEAQIMELYQKAYENALYKENIVLSRSERNRLFSQIMQLIFEDLLKNHGNKSTSS
jgi:hypothetical protein